MVSLQTPPRLPSPSGDCKYKFGPWGPCDAATNTKGRSGTLKKVLFNADCQSTVKVSKPCSPKVKKGRGEKNKGQTLLWSQSGDFNECLSIEFSFSLSDSKKQRVKINLHSDDKYIFSPPRKVFNT